MLKKLIVVSKHEFNPQYRWIVTSYFTRIKDYWYKVLHLGTYEASFLVRSKDIGEMRDKAAPDFKIYTAREWRMRNK